MAFLTNMAFPGALGYGRISVGGSGRHLSTPATSIKVVTNLNDSGSGSLREACTASGPRTVIFGISGTIVLTSNITINNPYITIAGQTAPSPGISIRGGQLIIRTNDVIIRHIRGRVGDNPANPQPNRDNFSILGHSGYDARRIIIANCSSAWSTDQLYKVWAWSGGSVHDVTYQDMVGGEPLDRSIHTDGTGHPYGPIFGGGTASPERISIIRNLLVSCNERNPRIGKNCKQVEIINNGVFNWNAKQTCNCKNDGGTSVLNMDFIGNAYIAGNRSDPASYALLSGGGIHASSEFFVENNLCPQRPVNSGSEWDAVNPDIPEGTHKSLTRVADSGDGYTPIDVDTILDWLQVHAGARPNDRDSVDERIVGYVDTLTSVDPPDTPGDVGGYPNLAVNTVSHSIPANPNSEGTGGYTVLENWMEAFHTALIPPEPPPDVPTPPPPDPTPTPTEPTRTVVAVGIDLSVSRYKNQRFVNRNGTGIGNVCFDSRDQQVASPEEIDKLED